MKKNTIKIGFISAIMALNHGVMAGPSAVNLGVSDNFVILAKTGVSTTGSTLVIGDIGISPAAATYVTGFGLVLPAASAYATSALVTGKIYASDYADPTPAYLTTAVLDMQIAYTDAAGRAPDVTELGAGNIGGLTLAPGVYKWSTGLTIPTDVTLVGGANDVWIFQIAQNLDVSSSKHIVLSVGAQAKNIFWQVAGQTTIATAAVFNGIILDQTAIVLNTGATLNGRALSQTAVTLDSNSIQMPVSNVQDQVLNQQVRLYVVPVFGPQSENPDFANWAAENVSNIHVSSQLITNLGQYLKTSYFAADTSQMPFTNYTVRYAVHVVASNPSYLFSPNGLSFGEKSSDTLINYGFVYTNPPASYYGYSPQAMGVVWGVNGSPDIIYTNSENWTNLVNEFIFIGPQSVCYSYGPSYTLTELGNYLDSVSARITGTWSLNDTTTNSIVSSSRTFYRTNAPYQLKFTKLTKLSGQSSQVDYLSSLMDTWTIQTSTILNGSSTNWIDIYTVSGAGSIGWSSINSSCFFRAVLQ